MTPTAISAPLLQPVPTVAQYFQSFNADDFATTAALFSPQGCLLPPFEEPIVGRAAIQAYLHREAVGMQATPKAVTLESLPEAGCQVVVKGSVKAIVFQVNAAWKFELTANGAIAQLQVKLLASLQELVTLR